jgi:hypothetical protein
MMRSGRQIVRAGTFEIVVATVLSPALVAAFDGFTVSRIDSGTTHLVGWVDDQARLNGLLELMADLTIELVSVNRLPEETRRDDVPNSRQTSPPEIGDP